jgi:hypothetical protein
MYTTWTAYMTAAKPQTDKMFAAVNRLITIPTEKRKGKRYANQLAKFRALCASEDEYRDFVEYYNL